MTRAQTLSAALQCNCLKFSEECASIRTGWFRPGSKRSARSVSIN